MTQAAPLRCIRVCSRWEYWPSGWPSPLGFSDGERTPPSVTTVVRYAADDVLMSGWLLGEYMEGKDAVVGIQLGRGRVIMFGFSPYFRSWPHATFKLFFNALYR